MCNRGKSCSILQTIPTQQIQTIPTEVDGSSCPHNTDQLQTLLRGVMLQSSLSSCSPRPFRNSACETSVEEPRSHRTRLPGKVQTCSTSAHPSDAQGSLSAHSGDGVAKPPLCPHPLTPHTSSAFQDRALGTSHTWGQWQLPHGRTGPR